MYADSTRARAPAPLTPAHVDILEECVANNVWYKEQNRDLIEENLKLKNENEVKQQGCNM